MIVQTSENTTSPLKSSRSPLAQPFTLPNGQVIKNRIAKSAMSETMASPDGRVPSAMPTLYGRFANGGVGLQMTGNVMVDRQALGEPGNVVIEDERDMDLLREWATKGQQGGAVIYMQVNHPGRQAPGFLNKGEVVAPSVVEASNPTFATPRALTEAEIEGLVVRYGRVAAIAEKAGFDGAQIHGAHGYLVSQFLSPITNRRTDKWGGSAENRRRFATEVYREMRRQTSKSFGVSIKINSADFQRGGADEQESLENVLAIAEHGMDFVEISGGTFESPAMTGVSKKQSTLEREAYFLEFAEKLRKNLKTPLGVTGGWRTGRAMSDAVDSGAIDFVGLARGLAVYPDFPSEALAQPDAALDIPFRKTGIKAIDDMAVLELVWYERQLHRMGKGKETRPNESPLWSLFAYSFTHGLKGFRSRRQR